MRRGPKASPQGDERDARTRSKPDPKGHAKTEQWPLEANGGQARMLEASFRRNLGHWRPLAASPLNGVTNNAQGAPIIC